MSGSVFQKRQIVIHHNQNVTYFMRKFNFSLRRFLNLILVCSNCRLRFKRGLHVSVRIFSGLSAFYCKSWLFLVRQVNGAPPSYSAAALQFATYSSQMHLSKKTLFISRFFDCFSSKFCQNRVCCSKINKF